MLYDKLSFFKLTCAASNPFVWLGVANIFGYLSSHFMTKQAHSYFFEHKGDGRTMQPLRSMVGSNRLSNIIWTAPSLILGGMFIGSRAGSLNTFKFFFAGLFSCVAAQVAAPATKKILPIWHEAGFRSIITIWSCADFQNQSYMGADSMAALTLYTCAAMMGMWRGIAIFAAFDLLCYGPMMLAPITAASAAAVTML